MNENTSQQQDRFSWFGESVIVKCGLIGILTLILLIPSGMIQDLIWERQQRQEEVTKEISDNWSGDQLLQGPVMVIPYRSLITVRDTSGKQVMKERVDNIYLLPETLTIKGNAEPEMLHRGIFDAVVYNSKLSVNGKFAEPELEKSGIDPERILWNKAKICIGLSDLKGLKSNPVINLDKKPYEVEPDFNSLKLFDHNLIVQRDLSATKSSAMAFSFDLDIRGSDELSFLHLGKATNVSIGGKWNNPSFSGRYLPDDRKISDSTFAATWKMPYFNRPFPQQWIAGNNFTLNAEKNEAVFGVKFMLPVDQYQKTMRSAKYAILIILLTFISLLFTELINKRRVHLLQYVLVGAAMTIYYILLLSFSEQVGFDLAYLIASVATVGLIGTFISAVLKNKTAAAVFSGILSIFYLFIYVIIQLQDLALLFGSIGLFIIVAALMYISARIDWGKTKLATT